jgi:hypothetical protein
VIEQKLVRLAHDVFKSYKLEPQMEFHASFIYQGKGPFNGRPVQERIDLFLKLADILAEASIKRVSVEIVTLFLRAGPEPAWSCKPAHDPDRRSGR